MSELPGVLSVAADTTAGVFGLSADTLAVLFFALQFAEDYENWKDYADEILSDADIDDIDRLVGVATYEVLNMVELPYPPLVHIETLEATKLAGTTLSKALNTSQFFNHMVEVTPAAINNELQWPFYAKAGQYDFHVLGARGTNYGIVAAKIDGNFAAGGQTWYNAVAANNIEYIYSIVVPSDGLHTFGLITASKTAASSSYRFIVSSIYAVRTGP